MFFFLKNLQSAGLPSIMLTCQYEAEFLRAIWLVGYFYGEVWKSTQSLQILWSIALKLQIGKDDDKSTNIMANQVKTPIQNYFEKVLYENLTFEIPPLWFFLRVVEG
jgi:hypothetical protein